MKTVLQARLPTSPKIENVRLKLKVRAKAGERDKRTAARVIGGLAKRLELARVNGRSTLDVLWLPRSYRDLDGEPQLSPSESLVFAYLHEVGLKPTIDVVFTGWVAGKFEGYHVIRANSLKPVGEMVVL